jgi:hypothetical protein
VPIIQLGRCRGNVAARVCWDYWGIIVTSIDAGSQDERERRQRFDFPFIVDLVGGRGVARLLNDLLWLDSDDEMPVGGFGGQMCRCERACLPVRG